MEYRALPSIEYLRRYFRVDADTGHLFRFDMRSGRWRGPINLATRYKQRRVVKVGEHQYTSARIVYAVHFGEDPGQYQVDHINGDIFDERPCNLRTVPAYENCKNRRGSRHRAKLGKMEW